jgi:hypothetical protein
MTIGVMLLCALAVSQEATNIQHTRCQQRAQDQQVCPLLSYVSKFHDHKRLDAEDLRVFHGLCSLLIACPSVQYPFAQHR